MKNWANPWRISFPSSMKISTSFWRNFLQSFLSYSGMVALNIITCLLWGVLTKISWISALIPGFPITLSHSSITKNLIWMFSETFYLAKVDDVVSGQIFESAWGSNNNMWVFIGVLEFRHVVFKWHSSKECSKSQLGLLEISAWNYLKNYLIFWNLCKFDEPTLECDM